MLALLSPLQRRLAGLSLIGFVAFLYAQDVIDPTDGLDNAARVAAAAEHPERVVAAAALLVASSAFMIPAIAAIVAIVRERGKTLAWLGAGLALLGALGHAAVAGFYAALSGLPGGDRREMTAVLDRIDESAAAGVVILPAIAGFALGVFVLVLALARARVLRAWVALVPPVSVAIQLAGLQPWAQLDLAQTIGVLPFLWLGARLLTTPAVGAAPKAVALARG